MANQTLGALLQAQEGDLSQAASPSDMLQQLIDGADSNGDGALTADEIKTKLGGQASSVSDLSGDFAKLDSDGDGKLTSGELQSAMKSGHHGPPGGPPPSSADMASNVMSALDGDGDGQLSTGELSSVFGDDASDQASSLVSSLDANGDGTISADELSQGLAAFRPSGPSGSSTSAYA